MKATARQKSRENGRGIRFDSDTVGSRGSRSSKCAATHTRTDTAGRVTVDVPKVLAVSNDADLHTGTHGGCNNGSDPQRNMVNAKKVATCRKLARVPVVADWWRPFQFSRRRSADSDRQKITGQHQHPPQQPLPVENGCGWTKQKKSSASKFRMRVPGAGKRCVSRCSRRWFRSSWRPRAHCFTLNQSTGLVFRAGTPTDGAGRSSDRADVTSREAGHRLTRNRPPVADL